MKIKNNFQYMLAPIEDHTDSCFRSICYGADLTFTELVRVDALANNNASSLKRIKLYDDTPTVLQLIGQKEKTLEKFLSTFTPSKGFSGFNINVGCPVPNFVNQGLGCAMIKRISKVKRITHMITDYGYSTSIKMRLGLNQREKEKKVYLNLIEEVDADFFVIHARHGNQSYSDQSDWNVFPECIKTGKTIIANGDIISKMDVEQLMDCAGVMIGRAAVANPRIFAELKGLPLQPVDVMMSEYNLLIKKRKTPNKYKENILNCINQRGILEE